MRRWAPALPAARPTYELIAAATAPPTSTPSTAPWPTPRLSASDAIAFFVPCAGVVGLSLAGGAFDRVLQEQLGLAVWWLLLMGCVIGILPVVAPRRRAVACLGLFALFCAWTAASHGWSGSPGNTSTDLAKVLTYLGFFAAALALISPETRASVARGLGAGIAIVAFLAALSRMHPEWFPASTLYEVFRSGPFRLAYPLNYWNGLAGLIAIGVPLMLWTAATGPRLITRALAAGALPPMVLAVNLTSSRGGALAILAGVVALIAWTPRRLSVLTATAWATVVAAALVGLVQERHDLQEGLPTALARAQGREALWLMIGLSALAAAGQVGIALGERRLVPRFSFAPTATTRRAVAAATAALCVVGFIAANGSHEVADAWHNFKKPVSASRATSEGVLPRLNGLTGSGRYQMWDAALGAAKSAPLDGIGSGTYEFWWSEHGKERLFLRDAHSLFLETFAELGIVGLLMLAVFFGAVLWSAAAGALRPPSRPGREVTAAAGAAFVAFAVAVGIDWSWEITVISVIGLTLGAVVLVEEAGAVRLGILERRAVLGVGLLAVPVIALLLAAATLLGNSQAEARRGSMSDALADARTAARLTPYAAGPRLQEALVLERLGHLDAAVRSIDAAIERERVNWQLYLARSRMLAKSGHPRGALADFERARRLAPRASVFTGLPSSADKRPIG